MLQKSDFQKSSTAKELNRNLLKKINKQTNKPITKTEVWNYI